MTADTDRLHWAEVFDDEHPDVWQWFATFAFRLIDAGRKRASADELLHRIRWERRTSTEGKPYKICNELSAYYGRKFKKIFPSHADFFRFRPSRFDVLFT